MQNFIVLGIIPGTNYQTSLNFWVGVTLCLLAILSTRRLLALARHIHTYLLARRLARFINHFDLVTI